jgi:hypothetical protein
VEAQCKAKGKAQVEGGESSGASVGALRCCTPWVRAAESVAGTATVWCSGQLWGAAGRRVEECRVYRWLPGGIWAQYAHEGARGEVGVEVRGCDAACAVPVTVAEIEAPPASFGVPPIGRRTADTAHGAAPTPPLASASWNAHTNTHTYGLDHWRLCRSAYSFLHAYSTL